MTIAEYFAQNSTRKDVIELGDNVDLFLVNNDVILYAREETIYTNCKTVEDVECLKRLLSYY